MDKGKDLIDTSHPDLRLRKGDQLRLSMTHHEFHRKRSVELFLGMERKSDAHYPLSPARCKLSVGEMAPMWGKEL